MKPCFWTFLSVVTTKMLQSCILVAIIVVSSSTLTSLSSFQVNKISGKGKIFIYMINNFFLINKKKGKHKTLEQLTELEKLNLQQAIEGLHKLKVVHNDLKWDNIIFGDNGHVYVIDYGFSKLSNKELVTNNDENSFSLY